MKTPKLLLDRLPADFHERLCNWREVMRDRRRRAVSRRIRCAAIWPAGQTRNLENEVVQDWDEADAGLIERAWSLAASYRMHPQAPLLLRAYYVMSQPPYLICRMQGIRAREFDDILVRRVAYFQQFVAQFENRLHNFAQSVIITV